MPLSAKQPAVAVARIMAAWPQLPEPIEAAILALVQAALPEL
jgi:hypothetical protein